MNYISTMGKTYFIAFLVAAIWTGPSLALVACSPQDNTTLRTLEQMSCLQNDATVRQLMRNRETAMEFFGATTRSLQEVQALIDLRDSKTIPSQETLKTLAILREIAKRSTECLR